MSDTPTFTCPRCGMTSHHPLDVHEGYCGNCHDWTGTGGVDLMGNPRLRVMHYDRQGKPIPLSQWTDLIEYDPDYRQVASTQLGTMVVSTVWLGIDHGFGVTAAPLIFETMVFSLVEIERGISGDVHRFLDFQMRYATEAAALAGHDRVVAAMREGRTPEQAYATDDE